MSNQEVLAIIDKAAANRATQLNISGRNIDSLPSEIGNLKDLLSLTIYGTNIRELPPQIGELTNLKKLDIIRNGVSILPIEIGGLINLETLSLSHNHLSALPAWIGKLKNLNQLYVFNNNLTELPSEIGDCKKLEILGLTSNQIAEIPPDIGNLSDLKVLHLSNNKLVKLPLQIGKLSNLRELYLRDNEISSLPPEIRSKSVQEIIRFYKQKLDNDTDFIYEAKLLIVGEPGAGKTSLSKKIQDLTYQLQPNELSTEGIDIVQWKFPMPDGKYFKVNIWDFGGQEIYHLTHQFFLTKRSFYILVADTRKEDTDFYYWLNIIDLLSDQSPLLIVKNEIQDRTRELNEGQLRGDFTNLKEVLPTNLATNRGLNDILGALQYHMNSLPHIGDEIPKNWVKVREILEQDRRDYIALEEYFEICRCYGFTKPEDALQLSEYLHDLGIFLHFQEDDLLMRIIILKPRWGTDAVYSVLDNEKVLQQMGRFSRDDLKDIWKEKKYISMRPELLSLMMNFKLCYEIPNISGQFIAPQLLSAKQPEYQWCDDDNLFLRYEYEFMPKGILTRFIVETHHFIEEQSHVWKTGVILNKDESRAEVIEVYQYHKGEIRIRVSGKRKRDLLTLVRHELDKIHTSYTYADEQQDKIQKLSFNTFVPCNCRVCKTNQTPYFYSLEALQRFIGDDQSDIQCQISYDMINVRTLVDDVNSKAFEEIISEKEQDEEVKDQLRQELNLRNIKIGELRKQLAIETDTATKFKLEHQVESEENQRDRLVTKMNGLS